MSESGRQKVVIGIIYNQSHNKILLSRRPIDVHQGGMLEIPGGKSVLGEVPSQTLRRELKEEINIQVLKSHRLISYNYDYNDKRINLSAWIVDEWKGVPRGNEGQAIEWARISDLKDLSFPQANMKLINALNLPLLYFITPDLDRHDDKFFKKIESLVKNGLRLLQFRSPSTNTSHHKKVLRKLLHICEQHNCSVIYNGSVHNALKFGAHGAHLNSSRLMGVTKLKLPSNFQVSASCHNEDELKQAERLGLDFCVLSPVHKSLSHLTSKPIGWNNFSLLVKKIGLPVYALGGIRPDETYIARRKGAFGIAMVSGVWDASDPISVIKMVGKNMF